MLMDKKCDQSGMRNYVEGQVNRNPKCAPSILFATMDQYADEDTDIEENVIVNDFDEEHADEDGSDIEAQVNWNIATEAILIFLVMRRGGFLIGRGGHSRLQVHIPETATPEPRRTLLRYLPARFVAKHRRPLASALAVKILKKSQMLNLREIENRRRQNTPLITTEPRKAKRFNIRYRRRQRRKTQNPSSAQPATATIETDSNEEGINFSTRSLHAMAMRKSKKYCWNGACIDTGAQRTVIGLAQARAYYKFLGIPFALSNSKRVFVFGWTNGIRSAFSTCDCQLRTVALLCWKSMSCRQMSLCYSM
jgi:hypothetical protein